MWWSWNTAYRRRRSSASLSTTHLLLAARSTCRFQIGEEVVVRLDDADVFSVDRAETLPQTFRPHWTIGRILARRTADTRTVYVLRFRCHGQACVTIVHDDAVEGVA